MVAFVSGAARPPALPLTSLMNGALLTSVFVVIYLGVGLTVDVRRRRLAAMRGRIQADLALVLLSDDTDAAGAADRLTKMPRTLLFDMVQRLSSDLSGDADTRLRTLVSSSGMARDIRSRLHSRSWRRRAQGAALAPLLPDGDPDQILLLGDPSPTVRARAAESVNETEIAGHVDMFIALLDDPNSAVRFAAQQALLKADARIVPALDKYLTSADGPGARWALEVAANFPDPRLVPAIRQHVRSSDPKRRAMATRALGPWLTDYALLEELFEDDDEDVRATAAMTAAAISAEVLAGSVGRLLRDEAWAVRRAAGLALSNLGPAGSMTLRVHLQDDDRYAREMAQQMLATIDARFNDLHRQSTAVVAPGEVAA